MKMLNSEETEDVDNHHGTPSTQLKMQKLQGYHKHSKSLQKESIDESNILYTGKQRAKEDEGNEIEYFDVAQIDAIVSLDPSSSQPATATGQF